MAISTKPAIDVIVGDNIFAAQYYNDSVSKAEEVTSVEPLPDSNLVTICTDKSELRLFHDTSVDYVVPGHLAPKWSWDSEMHIGYLDIQTGRVAYTREVAPQVMIDYDKNGNALGVEVLDV
jgi:hypothetical protein